MTKLSSQSKAVILIIKDLQVQLLCWENKKLSLIDQYADYQDGQARFNEFLDSHLDYPLIILTDVIEESFRNENVVHVSSHDRKALLERKLSYSFRNTLYRAARITGREDTGRRDDTVMLSAITKPELVNPWVEKVLSKKMAIQSISSVAYLTEDYLSGGGSKTAEHLMLVSLEDGNNLRQTYLKSGRVLFSRLTTLASADPESLGASVYHESLQIRQYLERIKLISYQSLLEIRVFSPQNRQELEPSLVSSDLNSFECFDARQESLGYNLNLKDNTASGLYAFLANVLQKKRMDNHYGPFDVRRYFYLKRISQGLAIAAFAVVVVSMAINVPALSDALDKKNLKDLAESQSIPLRAEYDRLTQRFPETPIDSKEMALVVETSEAIQQQSYMPIEAMNILSQALVRAPDLQISSISWIMQEEAPEEDGNQGFYGYTPPAATMPGMEFTQAVLDSRVTLHVVVDGVAYSPNSYREAQDQVLDFVEALEEFPGVSVVPLKMPTDVRVDTQVSTTVDDTELRAAYSLELTLEAGE